jgi:hypothetical protein
MINAQGLGILPVEYTREMQNLKAKGIPQSQWVDYLAAQGVPPALAQLVKMQDANSAHKSATAQKPPQATVADQLMAENMQQHAADQARQGGIAALPNPVMARGMAGGGIVAFSDGGPSFPQGNPAGSGDPSQFGQPVATGMPPAPTPYTMPQGSLAQQEPDPDVVDRLAAQYTTGALHTLTGLPDSTTGGSLRGAFGKHSGDVHDAIAEARENLTGPISRDAMNAQVEAEAKARGIGEEDVRYGQYLKAQGATHKTMNDKQLRLAAATALFAGMGQAMRPGQGGSALSQIGGALATAGEKYGTAASDLAQKHWEAVQQLELANHNVANHVEATKLGLMSEGDKRYGQAITQQNDAQRRYDELVKTEEQFGLQREANANARMQVAAWQNPGVAYAPALKTLQAQYAAAAQKGDTVGMAAIKKSMSDIQGYASAVSSLPTGAYVADKKGRTAEDIEASRESARFTTEELKALTSHNSELNKANADISMYSGVSGPYAQAAVRNAQQRKQEIMQRIEEIKTQAQQRTGGTSAPAPAAGGNADPLGIRGGGV